MQEAVPLASYRSKKYPGVPWLLLPSLTFLPGFIFRPFSGGWKVWPILWRYVLLMCFRRSVKLNLFIFKPNSAGLRKLINYFYDRLLVKIFLYSLNILRFFITHFVWQILVNQHTKAETTFMGRFFNKAFTKKRSP